MPGRILNFSEFFGKYSQDSTDNKKGLSDIIGSSANFEEGFDQDSYNKTELGPNKPVQSGSEATPPIPGEVGSLSFNGQSDEDMNAPEETQESPEIPEESTETPEESEEEEVDETDEEKEEDETPEPEAGANPDKKVEESIRFTGVKGFKEFVNEMEGAEYLHDDDWSDNTCPGCNQPIEYVEEGAVCGCNM
jgi:hypothetical protein